MTKLTYEDKVNIYNDRKMGLSIKSIANKYSMTTKNIQHMLCLAEKHGIDILKKEKNKNYPIQFKQDAIDRVLLNNEAIWAVSLDIGLPSDGILPNWIKKYKENGYNIVERKRGRSTMPKVTKKKENETDKEKIKRLEEENLYLKAELEYSKKLRAVVQARKNQQQKKK